MGCNYVNTLDHLLKIRDSHKKPTTKEQGEFLKAWVELATDEGYSSRAEMYLFKGARYCGAEPLKFYLLRCSNPDEILSAFFAGQQYGVDATKTFRLVTSLLAHFINDTKTWRYVPHVIKYFTPACKGKDGKRLGTVEATILSSFIDSLKTERFPDFDRMNLNQAVKSEFINTMNGILAKINATAGTKKFPKKRINTLARVTAWVNTGKVPKAQKTAAEKQTKKQDGAHGKNKGTPAIKTGKASALQKEEAANVPVAPVPENDVPVTSAPVHEASDMHSEPEHSELSTKASDNGEQPASEEKVVAAEKNPLTLGATADMGEYLLSLVSDIKTVVERFKVQADQEKELSDQRAAELLAQQKLYKQAVQQLEELRMTSSKQRNTIETLQTSAEKMQATLTALQEKVRTAENDAFTLRQTAEEKDARISELEAELAERIKLTEILRKDREKQADEALQRIASKVRVEYRDFLDAQDVPMSTELGENLKFQMENIFDILEKGGMKIK